MSDIYLRLARASLLKWIACHGHIQDHDAYSDVLDALALIRRAILPTDETSESSVAQVSHDTRD